MHLSPTSKLGYLSVNANKYKNEGVDILHCYITLLIHVYALSKIRKDQIKKRLGNIWGTTPELTMLAIVPHQY